MRNVLLYQPFHRTNEKFAGYQVYHLLLKGGRVPFSQLDELFNEIASSQRSFHLSPPSLIPSLLSCFPPCFQREGIDHPIKVDDMTRTRQDH